MRGTRVEEYRAPLLVAWQLTNRCDAACLTCCEDSGPQRGWPDELSSAEALDLTNRLIAGGVPYVAFGGGEPLGVPHCWRIFELLAAAGVGLKLETDARHIDATAADRLAELPVQCIQVSVDGASAPTHERVRPGSDFAAAIGAIRRLVARGRAPQLVFVPTRLNVDETLATYDLAAQLGCEAFVTGPLMRLGRAAADWDRLACSPEEWQRASRALEAHHAAGDRRLQLAIYPWDIQAEIERRLASPQAMLLVVPNGLVKLMNALPFAVADLRRQSIAEAWDTYRIQWKSTEVAEFVRACRANPQLLRHANETWMLGAGGRRDR
ncbi:MAG TPA: radical SAM protein [Steroidobacteraceae bacterium]|nr:radical SAM protein [Steroidobacteraceae bacterium]